MKHAKELAAPSYKEDVKREENIKTENTEKEGSRGCEQKLNIEHLFMSLLKKG